MNDWGTIVQAASMLLALISGVGAVPIINWLKDTTGLGGRWAYLPVAVVATVLALLNMVVAGEIDPSMIRPETAVQLVQAVLLASQVEYRRLKDEMG